jgi:hypothetical protein
MRCFILVCTVLNKENPIYDESKWDEQKEFIKFVSKRIIF